MLERNKRELGENNADRDLKFVGEDVRAGLGLYRDKLFFEKQIACEWLTTKEAAHFLSISSNALRIMVHRGQIPVAKFGRRLRFRFEDCRALFKMKGV